MNELTMTIPDMSCSHCAASVSQAVESAPGVSSVRVDLQSKRVEVAGEGLEPAAVVAAVREAGYEPEQR